MAFWKSLCPLRALDSYFLVDIFLQETHLLKTETPRIKRACMGNMYYSNFSTKLRGTTILFRKNFPFSLFQMVADPNGHFVILSGCLYGLPVILANAYGPTWDDSEFFISLFSSFSDWDSHYIVLAGDFNHVQNPMLDRSSSLTHQLSKSAVTLESYCSKLGLVDPLNSSPRPNKTYSYFSQVHRLS